MPTFWENVLQLARFFISSVTGLIFILISPVIGLKKNPFFFSLVLGVFIVVILLLYQLLQAMLGMNEVPNTI
nr:Ycf33 [Porphyrostromium boryanum]